MNGATLIGLIFGLVLIAPSIMSIEMGLRELKNQERKKYELKIHRTEFIFLTRNVFVYLTNRNRISF